MTGLAPAAQAQPFFLKAAQGARFCLFHPPVGVCRAALLYVPPFGEEMNKARRMAALQARALAAQGIGMLQIDLFGCGDSSGDFNEARWDIWLQDVALGSAWLAARLGRPVGLLGLRLGALLALDYARSAPQPPERIVLWQPVHQGSAFLTQFLRLRMANDMLADGDAPKQGTAELRATLRAGASLEVAGYELAPALAEALDTLELAALAPAVPVHWLDVVAAEGRAMTPAGRAIAQTWQEQGVPLTLQQVVGPAFWASQEISICPTLLDATSALYAEAEYAV